MATVQFENGQEVEFDGDPTPEDIDFVAKELGIVSSQGKTPEQLGQIQEEAKLSQQEAGRSTTSRFLEALPGETAKAIFQTPAKFAASGILSPIDIIRQLAGEKPIATELPLAGKTFQAEGQERLEQGASPLGTIGRAALEVPLAGAETLGIGKGIGKLRTIQQGRKALQKTAPVFSKAEELAAKEAGRVSKSIFGKVKLTRSPRDIEVAKSVEKIITSRNPFKNINRIRTTIAKTDDIIQKGIEKNNSIFNKNSLRAILLKSKEESRVVFGSDKTLEAAYDSVADEMIRQVNKVGKNNLSGLFQARKNFDQVIKQKFPKLFDNLTSDAPRTNAVIDVRRAANDFIASHLPKDSPFRALLHKENLMFEAIRNIAAKSPRLGTTSIGRLLKKPGVRIATGIAAGYAGSEAIRKFNQ